MRGLLLLRSAHPPGGSRPSRVHGRKGSWRWRWRGFGGGGEGGVARKRWRRWTQSVWLLSCHTAAAAVVIASQRRSGGVGHKKLVCSGLQVWVRCCTAGRKAAAVAAAAVMACVGSVRQRVLLLLLPLLQRPRLLPDTSWLGADWPCWVRRASVRGEPSHGRQRRRRRQ